MRLITPYCTHWHQVNSIFLNHWHILTRSKHIREIVGDRPSMVAKRVKNLSDTLVHLEYQKPQNRNWLTDMPRLKDMFPVAAHFAQYHQGKTQGLKVKGFTPSNLVIGEETLIRCSSVRKNPGSSGSIRFSRPA